MLISGGGTTLKNLIEKIRAGRLHVRDRPGHFQQSRRPGTAIRPRCRHSHGRRRAEVFCLQEEFSRAVFDHCRAARADLVVMAGFLKRVTIAEDFANRVTNIHPGLIPAFCGHGFYGHHVHQAVIDYGAKLSGCTIHFADNQYDHGPVILQRAVPVLDDDTADTLAARVFAAECEAYPEAIQLIAQGRVRVEGAKCESWRSRMCARKPLCTNAVR